MPEYKVATGWCRIGNEAGRQKTNETRPFQAIHDHPRRHVLPTAQKGHPAASHVTQFHAERLPPRFVAQIGNRFAIDIIFAHRERVQPLTEALRAFTERRHDIEREIERCFPFAVVPPSDPGSPLARDRRKGPPWVVSTIAPASKPQANPPKAR